MGQKKTIDPEVDLRLYRGMGESLDLAQQSCWRICKKMMKPALMWNSHLMPYDCLVSLLVSGSNIEVDITHIPGHANDHADALSRWDGNGDPQIISSP